MTPGVGCVATLASMASMALFTSAAPAQAVQLRGGTSQPGAQIIAAALAKPHIVIAPRAGRYVLPADSTYSETVVSLGNTVVVEGTVHGDLIVIGGDLYMHPGGAVDGRAVAIGGGVYESTLAHTDGVVAFHDFTYDVTPIGGAYALSYRSLDVPTLMPTFKPAGIKGVQVPSYDRSNGLSLPIGATITLPRSAIQVAPSLTYRSQLGRVDPMIALTAPIDGRLTARIEAGRETLTNDAWIRSNLVNSAEYLLIGDDTRNYYRASTAQATISGSWGKGGSSFEPYLGARVERATSVRPDLYASGGPWAFFNRRDSDDVRRPNPAIDRGTTRSVVAGAHWHGTNGDISARANLDEEIGRFSPAAGFISGAGSFAQTTLDGAITFPTFGDQSLRFQGHAVITGGNEPRQRWAYVGGPGSIPTLALLEQGGDHLAYLDGRYAIPFDRVALPFVGSPTVILREVLAGAAENRFPTLSQATGVRIAAGFIYAEALVDPVHRRAAGGLGISIDR